MDVALMVGLAVISDLLLVVTLVLRVRPGAGPTPLPVPTSPANERCRRS